MQWLLCLPGLSLTVKKVCSMSFSQDYPPEGSHCGYVSTVHYLDARTCTYLGSPTLLRLADGALLVCHDYFGPGSPHNPYAMEFLTSVYRSEDEGRTWIEINHLPGAYWVSLFEHNGAAYLLGCSAEYGAIVIWCSADGGYTWSRPLDENSGLLFSAGPGKEPPSYHGAPVPVVKANGRIYRAFESRNRDLHRRRFGAVVISAAQDSDLLQAANWTMTNPVDLEESVDPQELAGMPDPSWLEGNVVVDPQGGLWDVLRVHSEPRVDLAARLSLSPDGTQLSAPAQGVLFSFPGGMTKFVIRRHVPTGLYVSLVNNNTVPAKPRQRNVLSLSVSRDLWHWKVAETLIIDDSLDGDESIAQVGFQYVDWLFDGDDLLYLVRRAYHGAHNFHDSNAITFHRLTGIDDRLNRYI